MGFNIQPASWVVCQSPVALSTTAKQLTATPSTTVPGGTRTVVLQNLSTTINMYLGDSTVTNAGAGGVLMLLSPLQVVFLDIKNANLLYAVAASGTPSIAVSIMG